MTEWNIQSRAHACTSCGTSFADNEAFHTLLFDQKAEFARCDVCQPCWERQYSQGARERRGFISYWQSVYHLPPPPTEPIKKETAETLLRKLIELNDPTYVPAGYILAVMLERKRLLKVKEQVFRDSQRIFIYEQPATGDLFTIVDPNLQLNQLEKVQHDVARLLEHGLPTESAKTAPAHPAAPPLAEQATPSQPASEGPSNPLPQPIEPTPT